MNEESSQPISFGRRIALLAAAHPERTAVVFVSSAGAERRLSWAELEGGANRMARLLAERGVSERAFVVIGLPNCAEHLMVAIGVWKLGACVLPLNAALPARERDQILEVARPAVVVADWENVSMALVRVDELKASERFSAEPLPDRIPQPGKAVASGGSTGRPKVIVDPNPWVRSPSGGRSRLAD